MDDLLLATPYAVQTPPEQPVGILLEDETEVWNVDERMLIAPIPDQRHHIDGSSVVVTKMANTLDFWTKNPDPGEPENLTTFILFLERVMETIKDDTYHLKANAPRGW